MERVILHCDCNSFFASVETLEHPEYAKVPMAVTGDPDNRRGIILAKMRWQKNTVYRRPKPYIVRDANARPYSAFLHI